MSSEFVVNKYVESKDFDAYGLTPFLRNSPFDDKRTKKRKSLLYLIKNKDDEISKIENIYNLLKNDSTDLLKKYLLKVGDDFSKEVKDAYSFASIINQLDASIASKHYMNNILLPLMVDGTFEHVNEILTECGDLFKKHFYSAKEFLLYLDENNYFDYYLTKIPEFIIKYIKCIDQLVPIYDIYSSFDDRDLSKDGITTMDIDDMSTLYKKGYELLCDSIDLIIGISNIKINGSYDNFGNGLFDFNEKLNVKINSKFEKYKQFAKDDNDLFKGISGILIMLLGILKVITP